MTKLLQKAFEAASELSEAERDAMARWLPAELESEQHWTREFEGSAAPLSRLAADALAKDAAGDSQDLDPGCR